MIFKNKTKKHKIPNLNKLKLINLNATKVFRIMQYKILMYNIFCLARAKPKYAQKSALKSNWEMKTKQYKNIWIMCL